MQKEDAQATRLLGIIADKLAPITQDFQRAVVDKRARLLNMFTDPKVGIYALKGDARAGLRNRLCRMIVVFAESPTLFTKSFLNVLLLAGPGVGKSSAARVIANVYANLGLLVEGNVYTLTAPDLIGQYTGQTAPKTRAWLTRGLESVIFIDEAYSTTGCPAARTGEWGEYGNEFAATLVQFLDQHTGEIAVIAAGYKDKMQNCFLGINEGLSRRFSVQLALANYSTSDLLQILFGFVDNITDRTVQLALWQKQYISQWVERANAAGILVNQAGDMQNLGSLIAQDAVSARVVQPQEGYNTSRIDLTFRQFALSKGFVISSGGSSPSATSSSSSSPPVPFRRRLSLALAASNPLPRKRARSRVAQGTSVHLSANQ